MRVSARCIAPAFMMTVDCGIKKLEHRLKASVFE
jgi:hypothetical protein